MMPPPREKFASEAIDRSITKTKAERYKENRAGLKPDMCRGTKDILKRRETANTPTATAQGRDDGAKGRNVHTYLQNMFVKGAFQCPQP
jgi:hypothetical protein